MGSPGVRPDEQPAPGALGCRPPARAGALGDCRPTAPSATSRGVADAPPCQPRDRTCSLPDSGSHPPAVAATGLVKRFGGVTALDRVGLAVRRGEYFSLLGPSGCGKTTLLRVIAGLEQPDAGALEMAGRDVLPIPAHRRPVNTVFQNYALFPHLSVAGNVSFGLRMKRVPPAEVTDRTRRAMEMAQIAELAERMPAQ